MPSSEQLSANSLTCVRGEVTLFDKVNLNAGNGQCIHITGQNGSGKTSLLRILCGLSQSDGGHVLWNNQPIAQSSSFQAQSLYLAHKDGLKNELTAIENLRFYQQINGTVDEDKLDDCLLQIGLLDKADLSCQQLSFGQRRRLAFARCLLGDYPLWLLDEPFTGIDSQGRTLIESVCLMHLQNNGIIILTHHRALTDSILAPYLMEFSITNKATEPIA